MNRELNPMVAPPPGQPIRTTSIATGLDITAFILVWFVAPVGLILGMVGIHEAHKYDRKASGLSIAAVVLGLIGILVWIIVIAAIANSPSSSTDQYIACMNGQLNGTVPMSTDCTQYIGN